MGNQLRSIRDYVWYENSNVHEETSEDTWKNLYNTTRISKPSESIELTNVEISNDKWKDLYNTIRIPQPKEMKVYMRAVFELEKQIDKLEEKMKSTQHKRELIGGSIIQLDQQQKENAACARQVEKEKRLDKFLNIDQEQIDALKMTQNTLKNAKENSEMFKLLDESNKIVSELQVRINNEEIDIAEFESVVNQFQGFELRKRNLETEKDEVIEIQGNKLQTEEINQTKDNLTEIQNTLQKERYYIQSSSSYKMSVNQQKKQKHSLNDQQSILFFIQLFVLDKRSQKFYLALDFK